MADHIAQTKKFSENFTIESVYENAYQIFKGTCFTYVTIQLAVEPSRKLPSPMMK